MCVCGVCVCACVCVCAGGRVVIWEDRKSNVKSTAPIATGLNWFTSKTKLFYTSVCVCVWKIHCISIYQLTTRKPMSVCGGHREVFQLASCYDRGQTWLWTLGRYIWIRDTHAHIHTHTHTCTHTHVHTYTHTCTHTHIYLHTHTPTHSHTLTCLYLNCKIGWSCGIIILILTPFCGSVLSEHYIVCTVFPVNMATCTHPCNRANMPCSTLHSCRIWSHMVSGTWHHGAVVTHM